MIEHEFICDKCGNVEDISVATGSMLPKVKCRSCSSLMRKNYGAAVVTIPAHMKANSEAADTFSLAKESINRKKRRRTFAT